MISPMSGMRRPNLSPSKPKMNAPTGRIINVKVIANATLGMLCPKSWLIAIQNLEKTNCLQACNPIEDSLVNPVNPERIHSGDLIVDLAIVDLRHCSSLRLWRQTQRCGP